MERLIESGQGLPARGELGKTRFFLSPPTSLRYAWLYFHYRLDARMFHKG
jgi:hypothetical protein